MAQLLTLECSSREAVQWIIEVLSQADLQVATSFDLRTAREAHTECACPHHGTAACDCQLVVLLVYSQDDSPATLVLHGSDGHAYLSLADAPGQRPSPPLMIAIITAISSN